MGVSAGASNLIFSGRKISIICARDLIVSSLSILLRNNICWSRMDYDYSKISEREKSLLPFGFQGNVYNLSYKWQEIFPGTENPVKILEIGGYHGGNVCSLTKTYAVHTSSEIHVIDPWQDYDGYNEYKDKQNNNYSIFIKNISKLPAWDLSKIYLHRMKSEDIDKRFADEMFDIIYIDGNHLTKYVLEDSIVSLKKAKKGAWIIWDDVFDPEVKKAVQIFLHLYKDFFHPDVITKNGQLFLKKL